MIAYACRLLACFMICLSSGVLVGFVWSLQSAGFVRSDVKYTLFGRTRRRCEAMKSGFWSV